MTEPEPSASSKPTRKIPELTLWGKILTGVVVVLCCGGFFWYSNRDPSTAGQPSTGIDAEIICKDFVRNRLKAPSTAGFSDVDHTVRSASWSSLRHRREADRCRRPSRVTPWIGSGSAESVAKTSKVP